MRAFSFVLIPGLTLTASAQNVRMEQRQEPLAMGAKLWIKQVDGRVEIQGWDKAECALVAEFHDDARGGRANLEVRRVSEGLEIEVKSPQRPRFSFLSTQQPCCHLTLKVPRKLNLAVRSVDGNITVRDLEGYARCEAVDGDIRIENLSGEALTRTVDGGIEARHLKARIKGQTVDGGIHLEAVEGGVDLSTVDGNIEARELDGWGEGIFLSTRDGRIHVKLGQATGRLDIRTHDGKLEALAPGLQIQEMGTQRLRARIPGRNQDIVLKSGDGSITVE